MIDVTAIKNDFPILKRRINDKPIVYLDSTATALKPQSVIDAITTYYTTYTANVFRGIYTLSEEATAAYEHARQLVADFIHASSVKEIVFTKNTTESLNLLAYTLVPDRITKGDSVVTTIMEHHSNFVPWQQLVPKYGGKLRVWNIKDDGTLDIKDLQTLVDKKTKIVTLTAVSNVLGTITPVADIVKAVKRIASECLVIVDAAQAVPHMPVDVSVWGADAIVFSGHKMVGPSGIGVLWMKEALLEAASPFLYGGDMIREVHVTETAFNDIPHKFEAGTPFIEGAIGLGAAVSYLQAIGMKNIREHEKELTAYVLQALSAIPDVTMYGPKNPDIRGGVISFRLRGVHPHDVAQVLDQDNICIRVGYHCAMPLHEYLGIGATCRASFYMYTTKEDIDMLVKGIKKVQKMFS
ncbi:MAG: SufS family cysteine desulfurase [Candidatus Gottesmanbacteria bacterium]